MPYDPIQGHGNEPLKVGNSSIFKSYLIHHLQCELATDHWFLNYGTISKFDQVGFFIFDLIFASRDFEVGMVRPLWRVDHQSRTRLIYIVLILVCLASFIAHTESLKCLADVWKSVMECFFLLSVGRFWARWWGEREWSRHS